MESFEWCVAATSPDLNETAIRSLAAAGSPTVLWFLAQHPALPEDLVDELSRSKSRHVAGAALSRSTDAELLIKAARSSKPWLRRVAASSAFVPVEACVALESAIPRDLVFDALTNPAFDEDSACRLAAASIDRDFTMFAKGRKGRDADLAAMGAAHHGVAELLAGRFWRVDAALATAPGLSVDVYEKLMSSTAKSVHSALVSNPFVPDELFSVANRQVRRVRHRDWFAGMLDEARSGSMSGQLRLAAGRSPALARTILSTPAGSPSKASELVALLDGLGDMRLRRSVAAQTRWGLTGLFPRIDAHVRRFSAVTPTVPDEVGMLIMRAWREGAAFHRWDEAVAVLGDNRPGWDLCWELIAAGTSAEVAADAASRAVT